MDIKSKSKYLYIVIFIVSIYMLGLSLMSAFDFVEYRDYIAKDSYFKSYNFKRQILEYYDNMKILINKFPNYPQKSDDKKVDNEEIQELEKSYNAILNNKIREIQNQYNVDIASKQGNNGEIDRIRTEMNKKIEEVKKENTKNLDDIKSEIIASKNIEYNKINSYLESKKCIKYYIQDKKSGEIYTNLGKISNIEDFVKNKSLYSINFPIEDVKYDYIESINRWFEVSDFKGGIIVLKDVDMHSQLQKDYRYYNSIRERIIKEGMISVFSFIIGLCVLIFVIKNKKVKMPLFIEKIRKLYNKIPLDTRVLILIIYSLIMIIYQKSISFFYTPIGISHIIKLTIVAIYTFYIALNIEGVLILIKYREERAFQWKGSFIYRFTCLIKESFMIKKVVLKINVIFVLTVLFGIAIFNLTSREDSILIISIFYIFIYIFVVSKYVLERIALLNKIMKGTNDIVSGNLNHTIEENGKGNLAKLAHNINNMKEGFKKSVESQVKSERLKSELITNVSHDLKTPLTSIINYIDLLKKEDLSIDERTAYIEILDKKSQRLKILIEDLFEASKMASGSVKLDIQKVDITAILRQAMGEFDEKIKNSSLTFKVNIPTNNIYVNLDGKKTWRIFENLIGNILKYSQPKTRVYIDLKKKNENIVIVMKNISAYEMDFDVEEIFERFKRGDKARKTEGSGLGLAIAKSIVELQGGNMHIDIDGDLFKVTIEF